MCTFCAKIRHKSQKFAILVYQYKTTKNRGFPRVLSWQPQPDCKFPPRLRWRGGPLSARKVQTRCACFHQLRARTVPVQIWGADSKIKNDRTGRYLFWQPQPDSNWCSRLERAVSWASRRWGQNCRVRVKIFPKRRRIINGLHVIVKT